MKPLNGKNLWNYQLFLYAHEFDTEPIAAINYCSTEP